MEKKEKKGEEDKTKPGNFCFKFVVLLSEQLNAFDMRFPFSVQPFVLLWIRIFLLAHQMLKWIEANECKYLRQNRSVKIIVEP